MRIKVEVLLVSRIKQLLISLLLLSLIAWIVNGLVASDTVTISAFPLTIDLNLLADSFRYFIFLTFLVVAVGALIMLILGRRLGIEAFKVFVLGNFRDSNDRNFRWRSVAALAVFAILFITILFTAYALWTHGPLWRPVISSTNEQPLNSSAQPSSPTTTPTPTPLPYTLFFIAPIIVLLAMAFVGGLMAVQAMREIIEEATVPPKDDVPQKRAFNVVKEAISSIIHEGDFRAAIIKCYQKLCELLARYNCQIEDHQTAQEFRTSASKILNIPEKPFAGLTSLFEEARYSLHQMDEAKRNDALRFLAEIRDRLGSGY
jgi:hypothetical protein